MGPSQKQLARIASSIGLTVFFIVSLGCGEGFNSTQKTNANNINDKNSGSGGIIIDPNDPWSVVEGTLKGQVNGGSFDNETVFEIDRDNKMLIMRLPMPGAGALTVEASGEFPQLPGAGFELTSLNDGRWELKVYIPLEHLVKGFDTLPVDKLPNGDPLPSIPAGELPTLAFSFDTGDKVKPYLYLGPAIIALYLQTELKMPGGFNIYIKFPIRNADRTRVLGYLVTVPNKNGYGMGFFISLMVPPDIARIIDDLL